MHWLGNPVCPWSSQLRESKKFPRAAVPALLWSAHLQQTVWSFNAQTLLFVLPNVTFWWQNIKRIGLQCFALFSKKVFLCRGLKVSVKSRQSMFFVTVGLWVYPSPLSVAKLHPRMSYHRHICRKYAMKLCGSCTTGAICPPPPTVAAFPPAVCWGSMSVGRLYPVDGLSLPLVCFSYLCQLAKTGTWAQRSMTLNLTKTQTQFSQGVF